MLFPRSSDDSSMMYQYDTIVKEECGREPIVFTTTCLTLDRIVTVTSTKICHWKLDSGELLSQRQPTCAANGGAAAIIITVATANTGRSKLLIGTEHGQIYVSDIKTGSILHVLDVGHPISSLACCHQPSLDDNDNHHHDPKSMEDQILLTFAPTTPSTFDPPSSRHAVMTLQLYRITTTTTHSTIQLSKTFEIESPSDDDVDDTPLEVIQSVIHLNNTVQQPVLLTLSRSSSSTSQSLVHVWDVTTSRLLTILTTSGDRSSSSSSLIHTIAMMSGSNDGSSKRKGSSSSMMIFGGGDNHEVFIWKLMTHAQNNQTPQRTTTTMVLDTRGNVELGGNSSSSITRLLIIDRATTSGTSLIVGGNEQGQVILWQLEQDEAWCGDNSKDNVVGPVLLLHSPFQCEISQLQFCPQSQTIVVGGVDGRVVFFDHRKCVQPGFSTERSRSDVVGYLDCFFTVVNSTRPCIEWQFKITRETALAWTRKKEARIQTQMLNLNTDSKSPLVLNRRLEHDDDDDDTRLPTTGRGTRRRQSRQLLHLSSSASSCGSTIVCLKTSAVQTSRKHESILKQISSAPSLLHRSVSISSMFGKDRPSAEQDYDDDDSLLKTLMDDFESPLQPQPQPQRKTSGIILKNRKSHSSSNGQTRTSIPKGRLNIAKIVAQRDDHKTGEKRFGRFDGLVRGSIPLDSSSTNEKKPRAVIPSTISHHLHMTRVWSDYHTS